MGILYDDLVIIRQSETEGEPSMITVNCPDKTGLGCDLCRIFLFFGLTVARIDVSTDGKWCYLVFWVIGKPSTRWDLLTKRLLGACPSFFLASGIPYYEAELQPPRPPDVFLLKFCYLNRKGLLHDVTKVLCELELTIKKVKAEIGRYMIGDREWEVYRVLLDESDGLSVSREEIEQAVWKMLMGWE
ncbi:ACT domain-containing ACR10 [Olea europaea subsp. europaea]|uniref:ACT domain-containing protein ACR n=1 Tax=Olea europaea subsp. europaea TaxID=158383 RepID=A0A8S0QU32_OLEEU|nr:ACT domain-containing ACR10 [Olea europaea subsp. europaea]